ncbi:MAG TPA: T9SS type A sorting domain-containing protein, partial [Bacteroidia bacterium]|nr:T9SS type A sorting domain-containing protein [Bacteroidia bacterium]
NVVRKVNTAGTINTFAGTGTNGYTGDGGSPSSAELAQPDGIYADANGNIYIVDGDGRVIREISALCPANGGPNGTAMNAGLCCGEQPVTIGIPAVPNMTYSWSPSTNLSPSTTTATPTSSWTNTTTPIVYTVTVSYSLCTTNTSTVQVSAVVHSGAGCCRLATGIATANEGTVTYAVYPNPATQQITISLYDKADYVRIVDIQGRMVFETKDADAQDLTVDLAKYNKGIYFISTKIGDAIEKQKLIVE